MGKTDRKSGRKTDEWDSYRYLQILHGVTTAVGQSLCLEEVLNTAIEKIADSFKEISGIEIMLLDESDRVLMTKAFRGLSQAWIGLGICDKGRGLAGRVASDTKPVFVEKLTDDKCIDLKLAQKEGLTSYAGIPLLNRKKLLGVLGLYTCITKTFSDEEKMLLSEIGCHIGSAVRNAQIHEQAEMRTRRFTTISRAITVTRQLGTLDEVLQDITKVLVQSLGFDQSWIGLVDETGKILQGRVGFGPGMKEGVSFQVAIASASQDPAVRAIVDKKPVIYQVADDVQEVDFQSWLKRLRVRSFGYVPILGGEHAVGVIGVFYQTDQAFEEEDVKTLMSVSEQAAIAIENARLYERVKTSEERYRTLFESAGTSLVILDEEQRFRLVNHAFEMLSGYPREALIGKMNFVPFITGSEREPEWIIEKLKHPPQSWEAQFKDRNGEIKQIHITTSSIPESSDVLLSLSDMTQQRELERRLFRSEELAAIGELSAGIAHEIRNPLVAITTAVSLLKDESELSSEGQQLLDIVKEESDHLAAIVEDFLQFARPKKPTFKEEDIRKLLNAVVKKYKDLDENRVKWVERYEDSLPMVSIDRHQIQQVITNLLLNGLDAMQNGGVLTIEARQEKSARQERVRILVSDSGVGIPDDEISKIFQPFYSMKEKGTGMGLAICRRIMEEHDGEIFVESEVGKGTMFSLLLPVHQKRHAS
ncbi:MAG: GAF domain-containing protein [bacterium]